MHLSAAYAPVWHLSVKAGDLVAIGLPRSPAAAVLLILAALTVTYIFVTAFIRVGVPPSDRLEDEDRGGETDPETGAQRETGPLTDTVPPLDAPDPAWPSETVPVMDDDTPPGGVPPEYVAEPLTIDAISVHGAQLRIGDTASEAMRAFRPGEGETMPLVERDAAGQASFVSRTYRVGRHPLTLVFQRERGEDPLRLTRIEVGQ